MRSCTGGYWLEVVITDREKRVGTKKTKQKCRANISQYGLSKLLRLLTYYMALGPCLLGINSVDFRNQKIHGLRPFPSKRSTWQNPDEPITTLGFISRLPCQGQI